MTNRAPGALSQKFWPISGATIFFMSSQRRDSQPYWIYRRVLLFVCSMNHIPLYLLPSPKDDGDLKNTIFLGFHFTLCYQMLIWKICLEPSNPPFSSPTTNLRLRSPPPPKKKTFLVTLLSPLLLLSSKMAA